MSIEEYPVLYALDSKGKTRTWRMVRDGSRFRTEAGLLDGKVVISAWSHAEAKNEGRSNATTPEEQADSEIRAFYKKKLENKYYESIDQIERGNRFVQPMLAHKYDQRMEIFYSPIMTIFSQPKLDGIRMLASRDGFFSRQGKPFYLPELSKILLPVFENFPEIILDGELYNHELKEDFNSIVSLVKKQKRSEEEELRCAQMIQYHVYDVVETEMPFSDRFDLAKTIAAEIHSDSVKHVMTSRVQTQEELDKLYARYLEDGYEGQMIRLNKKYENKRSLSLLKRKEFLDEEFEIVEIQEGDGNWKGYAKRVKCVTSDGKSFSSGVKGNQDFTKELLANKDRYRYVTVRYQALTPDGIPRFPVAVDWHENRNKE